VRDTCLYVSITANIAIAAAYTQQQIQDANLLLFIPFASTLFFWVYATNDSKITQMRQYIVGTILPAISNSDGNSTVFGWEHLRRRRSFHRLFSKIARLLVVWITFSGASLVVLAATGSGFGFTAIWVVAAIFTALPYIFGLWLIDL
jgi:hypothetical protein